MEGIIALERIVQGEAPDQASLASARWKLTRASGRRRKLLTDSIYPQLQNVSAIHSRKLDELRADAAAQLAKSSHHIGKWTVEHIIAHWPDYQKASAEMTASMRRRVQAEKVLLYPLLAG